MTLTELCAPSFDPEVWARGHALVQQGHLTLTQIDEDAVIASAQPNRTTEFDIWVEFDLLELELKGICTCPDYSRGHLCHHIWATLLAADAIGWHGDLWPLVDTVTVYHQDETMGLPPLDVADERSLLDALFGALRSPSRRRVIPLRPRVTRRRRRVSRPPTWREQLRLVGQQSPTGRPVPQTASARSRQAVYIVDVARSLEAGGLYIVYHHQEQRQDGTFGKIKPQGVNWADLSLYESPADQRLLQLLLGHRSGEDPTRYPHAVANRTDRFSHCIVAPILYDPLVPELCATGRFRWIDNAAQSLETAHPLEWDPGPAWQFKLVVEADDANRHWRLQGQLVQDQLTVPLSEAVLLLGEGLVLFPTRIGRLNARDVFAWIVALRQAADIRVPFADRDAFLQLWWSAPTLPLVDFPPELDLPVEYLPPIGVFRVVSPPAHLRDPNLYATATLHYDRVPVDPDTRQSGIVDLNQERVIRRDPSAEQTVLAQLTDLGLRPNRRHDIEADYQFAARDLPSVTAALLNHGWVVEADGQRLRAPGEMFFQVTTGVDWFDIEGQVAFDDLTVHLPTLLRAVQGGERFIRLDDGSQGLLPEEWLARYGQMAELGQVRSGTIRFKPVQALLLDALLAEQPAITVDPAFERWREQLRGFRGIQPATPPEGFEGQLRPYQQAGLGWLHFLRDFQIGGCLADDMGLGKTVQVLALLASRREPGPDQSGSNRPSIVVVPRSLIFNWQLEAQRFTPMLRVVSYTGPNRAEVLTQLADADVLLTTYGTLRRDIVKLKDHRFDYAILDESQAIKNAASQVAKASRLLQADHRLALTGTPVENHLGELWSLFEFLNPGLLGRSSAFKRLTRSGGAQDEAHLNRLATALRPVMLRRTKAQVLTDLPEKTEQTLYCEMPESQRQLYDELRGYYRTQLTDRLEAVGLKRSKIQILEALLRLRQAACHPGLIDTERKGDASAKIEALLEQLDELTAEGHKALVFSQFTSLLAILRLRLDERGVAYAYLDGRTRKRQERVERFQQDPDCPLFLISLKAGGHGLNLTAAEYVFILDPWWNPAVEAQAIDRAHRIGQTQPVFAYRLICRDTVEEKILTLQQRKRELADSYRRG